MPRPLTLNHYKDSLLFSEVVSCAAIELGYRGKFIGESQLGNDWYVGTSHQKIICISLNGDQDVSELFKFQGNFLITNIRIVTKDLHSFDCQYDKTDIDFFGKSRENFEEGGSYFSDYDSEHEVIDTIDSNDIYKNNLFTKENEFFFKNGDNYFGAYHQHSNGEAMTESEHNSDSVFIYRKDEDGNLYFPKSKRLQPAILETLAKIQRVRKKKYKSFRQSTGSTDTSGSSYGGAGSSGEY